MHNRLKVIVEQWDFMDPDKRVINKSECMGTNNPSFQELLTQQIEQRDPFQHGQETEMYTAYMEGFSDKEMPLWSKFWYGDRDVMRRRNA